MDYDGIFALWMVLSLVYFSHCWVGIFLIIVACLLSTLYNFSVHELTIIFVFCHRWSLRRFSCLYQFKIAASWGLNSCSASRMLCISKKREWWCPVSQRQMRNSLGFRDLAELHCYLWCILSLYLYSFSPHLYPSLSVSNNDCVWGHKWASDGNFVYSVH